MRQTAEERREQALRCGNVIATLLNDAQVWREQTNGESFPVYMCQVKHGACRYAFTVFYLRHGAPHNPIYLSEAVSYALGYRNNADGNVYIGKKTSGWNKADTLARRIREEISNGLMPILINVKG